MIHWYDTNKRDLPWRHTSDPYKIWLSEVMLQQTRVDQGLPYYLKFVETFPSVHEMAGASEDKILRLWQGLGYYSRARNLHKCSKTIVEKFNGKFPDEFAELLKLPGIGPYTAAAISSIAFNKSHAVVDGNVQRVLARYLGISDNIAEASTTKKFHEALEKLIDPHRPGLFNQAIMELGATVCKPQKPLCSECPVADSCFANLHKYQDRLPFKQKKINRKTRYFNYWILVHNSKMALKKRGVANIWRGLYEFYLVEKIHNFETDVVLDDFLSSLLQKDQSIQLFDTWKHVLTHQDIYACFVLTTIDDRQKKQLESDAGYAFYSFEEVMELPKPVLIDKFLQQKIFD